MRILILVIGFLLLPSSSQAQDAWRRGNTTTDQSCNGVVTPGRSCFWKFNNDASTNSYRLVIDAEYATVCFDPNIANATDSGATVEIMYVTGDSCDTKAGSDNTAEPIYNGTVTVLTGNSSSSADCFYEVPTGCIWVDPNSSTTQDSIVKVTGAGRRR